MPVTRFISDLHLGHKNIPKYAGDLRGGGGSIEGHDKWIIKQWNSVVKKNDITWVLGDVAFTKEGLEKVSLLNGVKNLIIGNHDTFSLNTYNKYFNKIHGFMRYKDLWLSHPPIEDTRGLYNVHGHTHSKEVHRHNSNKKYICVCVEAVYGYPMCIDQVRRFIKLNEEHSGSRFNAAIESFKRASMPWTIND